MSRSQPIIGFPHLFLANHLLIVVWRITLTLLTPFLAAQEPLLHFEKKGVRAGLAQSTVFAITQDREGFLWFGTSGGLSRFDGYDFQTYRHDPNLPSLPDNEVHALAVDLQGRLWVGTVNGLASYDRELDQFIPISNPPWPAEEVVVVSALLPDPEGGLWVGTEKYGLVLYEQGQWRTYALSPDATAAPIKNSVTNLCEVGKGLWILDDKGQVWHLPDKNSSPKPLHLKDEGLSLCLARGLVSDEQGGFWAGLVDGICHYQKSGQVRVWSKTNTAFPLANVASLCFDEEDRLWIGSQSGLGMFVPRQNRFSFYFQTASDPEGLNSNNIFAAFADSAQTLWLGTMDNGLNLLSLDHLRFQNFTVQPGRAHALPSKIVMDLEETKSGEIYCGTPQGLVRWKGPGSNFETFVHEPDNPNSLPASKITSLYVDSGDRLWVSCSGAGLVTLAPGASQFRRVDLPLGVTVLDLLEDRPGIFWLATKERGLLRYHENKGTIKSYVPFEKNDLRNNKLFTLFRDSDGQIWTSFYGGLFTYNPEHGFLPQLVLNEHERVDRVLHIYQDPENRMYFACHEGLVIYDPKTKLQRLISEREGLANHNIYGVVPGGPGTVWVSSDRGLSRINTTTYEVRNFDNNDGIRSEEFNAGAALQSQSGNLLFGGIDGLVWFDPMRVAQPPLKGADVLLTQFTLFNKPVTPTKDSPLLKQVLNQTQELTLQYDHYLFGIEFASPAGANPASTRYAYRLDGLDQDWVETDPRRRFATYTNLSPKTYVFRVRAATRYGAWGPERQLTIHMLPPIWKTVPAYLLYALVVGLGIWAYSRRKQAQFEAEKAALARFNAALESQVEERTVQLQRQSVELSERNQELEAGNREFEVLDTIVRNVNQEMDFGSLCTTLIREVRKLLPSVRKGLFLTSQIRDGRVLSIRAEGIQTGRFAHLEEVTLLWRDVFNTMEQIGSDLWVASSPMAPALAVLRLPINDHQEGLVLLQGDPNAKPFRNRDLSLLTRFREHVQTAVIKARVFKELAQTQRELVEEAHLAGMAEIAANVLHNVGNTLNSVLTSAQLLTELQDREGGLRLLNRLVSLVGTDDEAFLKYLQEDPRAKNFGTGLKLVHEKLVQKRQLEHEELMHLVDRLKETMGLLAQQEQHARPRESFLERVNLNELADEVVMVKSHFLRRKKIKLIQVLEQVPDLQLDRNQLQRVLFYLIKNAWESIEEGGVREDSRILVSTGMTSTTVLLEVTDNGIGMAPSACKNAFTLGFTTKKGAKGFGLHYCANAIQEMKGGLILENEGPGKGARAKIWFPKTISIELEQPETWTEAKAQSS